MAKVMRLMMKTFKYVSGMLMMLFSMSVFAKDVSVEVTGSGKTKELAIESALIQAISQIRGIDVNSQSVKQANQIKLNGKTTTSTAIFKHHCHEK